MEASIDGDKKRKDPFHLLKFCFITNYLFFFFPDRGYCVIRSIIFQNILIGIPFKYYIPRKLK